MKLFISYSRDDKAWVYELWRGLRDRADHDAWIDQRLLPAQDWWETILHNIETCEGFIYVMTPQSVASIYCRAEVDYAVALNKPILPLMLKTCDYPDNLKNMHIQYQIVRDDMSLGDVLFIIERAIGEVREGLAKGKYQSPQPVPTRPDEPKPRQTTQVLEVFMLAEDAVNNNLTLAERLFQQVVDVDPQGYGPAAAQRLEEVRYERTRNYDYERIALMVNNPDLRKRAHMLWQGYVRKYGAAYDPEGLAAILSESVSVPEPKPPIVRPPVPPEDILQSPGPSRDEIEKLYHEAIHLFLSPKVDDIKLAIFKLEQILELDPHHADARLKLEELRRIELREVPQYTPLITQRIVPTLALLLIILVVSIVVLPPLINNLSNPTVTFTPTTAPGSTATPISAIMPTLTNAPVSTDTPSILPPTSTDVPNATLTTRQDTMGISQVWVPAGCFQMGSDPERDQYAQPDEQPVHEVCITKGFWIDQFEMTNEAYQRFVDDGGYQNDQWWSEEGWEWLQVNGISVPRDYPGFIDKEQPRVGISWYEAEAFASWRGGRLPTEAEWEYAARGPKARIYPWGDEYIPGYANIRDTFLQHTVAVDRFPRGTCWVGAYQLAGNVFEWVSDIYDPKYYQRSIQEDPSNTMELSIGRERVIRGGSWEGEPFQARSAFRFKAAPDTRKNTIGFRIVTPN